jgi:hypothetical protein
LQANHYHASLNYLITWLHCNRQIDRSRKHNKHLADPKEGSSG